MGRAPIAAYCGCGNTPCDGLDCGPYLPGCAPRKRPAPKSLEELREIRARAWATRRAKRPSNEGGDRG